MELQVQNSQFSSAPCYLSEQQRLNGFSTQQFVVLPDELASLIISAAQPTVEQQGALWLQTDANTNPVQLFRFSSQYAAWVWPHPVPANDERLVIFSGDSGDVDAIDGGNANAVTATDGPFWEIETEFTNMLPVGAGTTPVGVDEFKFATGTVYPKVRGVYFLRRTARIYLTP